MSMFNKTQVVPGKNFSAEFQKITAAFSQALESSRSLSGQMSAEIGKKQEQIVKIQTEVQEIEQVKSKADQFAENLARLLS